MKRTVPLLSALIFSLALMIPGLMWADDMKHMEEGSGMKMDKASHEKSEGNKHSKDHKNGKGHMKESSAGKEEYDKSADHKKMEEGSVMDKKMIMSTPRKEGS